YDPRLKALQKGQRLEQMALTIDLAPTILDLANIRNENDMQGRSILPLIKGHPTEWRTEFFYEHLFEHWYDRIPKTEAIRTERWKYIRYVGQEPVYEQLFDLREAPLEINNLMLQDGHEAIKEQMRRKWNMWHQRVRQ